MQRFAAWSVVLLGCRLLAQQGEEHTVVVRSLSSLLTPSLQSPHRMWSALPNGEASVSTDLDSPGDATNALALVARLLQVRHGPALQTEELRTDITQNNGEASIVLAGKARAVDAAARTLDAIMAVVARPIEVTAWQMPLPAGPLPAAVWSATATSAALQQARPLWTAKARIRSGTTVRLANERSIAIVRDLDAEVAEKAKIADPKVDLVFAGARSTLVCHALPGEQLLLAGNWLHSVPLTTHEQEVGPEQASIDQPSHFTVAASFAGRIEAGGALVVAGRGGPTGDGFLLVLSARFLAPPAGDPAGDLLLRPVGGLLPLPVAPRLHLGWRRPGSDPRHPDADASGGGIAAGMLTSALQITTPGEADIEDGFLTVYGSASACQRADGVLQQLFRQQATAGLSSRITATNDTAPLELVQPMLNDCPAGAFIGRERLLLSDQEVEIAQKSSIANPVVGIARTGLWLNATGSRSAGGWHLSGLWTAQAHDTPRLRLQVGQPAMHLQLVDYRTVVLPWDAPIAAGSDVALGDGPAWTQDAPPTKVSITLTPF